ncbi:hypothetical protein Tco_0132856 [Tanacetum coccineum]
MANLVQAATAPLSGGPNASPLNLFPQIHVTKLPDLCLLMSKLKFGIAAWTASFVGAMAIAELVKTALGTKGMCLVRWATPQLHDMGALAKMVDPALKGLYPVKSLSRFAHVIALCVQAELQQSGQSLANCRGFP